MAEDLLAILQARGIPTVEIAGWREAGGHDFRPEGVMVHHTAGRDSLSDILNGRALPGGGFLPPPLANLYIPKSGIVHIVAAGRANHTGPGPPVVLEELRRDVAPSGTATERGLEDKKGFGANTFLYGIEAENLGTDADPWPEAQLVAYHRTVAALCAHHGWPAARVIGHKEWTKRKPVDPNLSMADFRAAVADLLTDDFQEDTLPLNLAGTTPVPGGLPDALGRFPFWGWKRDGSVFAFNGAPGPVPTTSDKKEITRDGPVVALLPRTDGVLGYYLIAGQPDDQGGFPTFAFPKPGGRRARRKPEPVPPV